MKPIFCKSKSKLKAWLTLFFFAALIFPSPSFATSNHQQNLVIVKYGLSPKAKGFSATNTTSSGLKINHLTLDNTSNQIRPLANITYTIQEILPQTSTDKMALKNPQTYRKVGSAKAITTASDGQAQIRLSDGFYIVSEQANTAQGLKHPASPVLLEFPVYQSRQRLDTVYIYPKSSIDPQEMATVNQSKPPQKITGNLPKTGSVPDNLVFLGFLFLLTPILWQTRKNKSC